MNSLLCQIVGYLTDEFPPVSNIVDYSTDESPLCQIIGYFTDEPPPPPFVLDRCMHGYFTDESPTPPQGIYRWLLYWLISFCLRSLVPLLMNSLQCKISLVTLQMNPPPPSSKTFIVDYCTDEFPSVSDSWFLYWWIPSCVRYRWLLYWWIPSRHLSLVTLLMAFIVDYSTDKFPPLSYQIFSYFTEELVTWSYLLLFFFFRINKVFTCELPYQRV